MEKQRRVEKYAFELVFCDCLFCEFPEKSGVKLIGRLRSGTSRTNPPLAGETFDELHGLVNYFGVAFAYAFGYARFQMVAQQHF